MAATSLSTASISDNYRDAAVFMICMNTEGPYGYEIYSIDFKRVHGGASGSSLGSMPKPVKQLEKDQYPICMGFFSIGSKIYMVGGETYHKHKGRVQPTNRVFVYNTVTNRVSRGPPMLKAKVAPFVIGSVDGKVYVHGASLQDHNFERFDPELKKWSVLPSAPLPSLAEEEGEEEGFLDCRPFPENDIAASAVVNHTILLWTLSGHLFTFDINTNAWSADKSSSCLPFEGPAVLADNYFIALVQNGVEFPLCSFQFNDVSKEFVKEAPIEGLARPAGHIIDAHHRGNVAYLGNQHFCLVRSGYDGCPYSFKYTPRKHYITIDLFGVKSKSPRKRPRDKFPRLSAVDHYSLSYIMDENHPDEPARTICFATPILSPAVTID